MILKFQKLRQKPELLFVLIAGFFGFLSIFLMPILEVPDENQHFQVSYAMLSKNKAVGQDMVLNEAIIIGKAHDGTYWKLFTDKTSAEKDGIAINTGSLVFDGKTRASIFDAMRIPQALGIQVGKIIYPSIGVMVVFGRLFVLAFYLIAMYFIIKKIRYAKWGVFLLATIPIIIQQSGSLSYDAINIVAIFAWFAFIVNSAAQKKSLTAKQIAIGVLLIVFLLVSKSNNVLLIALLFALPSSMITNTSTYKKIRSLKYWKLIKYTFIATSVVMLFAVFYVIQNRLLAGHQFDVRALVSVLLNTFLWGDLTLIDVTTIGTIGQFSNFYYHLPVWIVILTYIVIVSVFLNEKMPYVTKKFATISLSLFLASVLLITIGMYYGWAMKPERLGAAATVADGIQGRYFTPLLVLLIPAFSYLRKHVKITTKSEWTIPNIAILSSVALLMTYTVQTLHAFWI